MFIPKSHKPFPLAWVGLWMGALLLLLLPGLAHAQGSPPQMSPPLRTITVVGQGSVTMKPDVAHTFIGVTISDENIKIASQKAQETIDTVRKALRKSGVAEKDIQTTNYSIHLERPPEMIGAMGMNGANRSKKEIKPLYVVNSTLSVTIRQMDKLSDILSAAIDAGANNIYGIDFSAENPEKVMAQARELAAKDARARAEELAALHGVAVGEVISITDLSNDYTPTPLFAGKAAGMGGGGGGFAPGQLQVTAHLQVTYAIKPEASLSSQTKPTPTFTPQPSPTPAPTPRQASGTNPGIETGVAPDKIHPLTIVGDDNNLLRKFVSYWFAQDAILTFPGPQGKDKLLLGRLPDEVPFDPKSLHGMTILGALSQQSIGVSAILLQTQLSPEDAIAHLAQAWKKEGLTRPELPFTEPPLGAFDVEDFVIPAVFCPSQGDFWIELTAAAMTDGATSVRINIQRPNEDLGDFSPCSMEDIAKSIPPGMELLPHLGKPKGARVLPEASGGGPSSFYQGATVISELSIEELADFYHKQLEKAGWEPVGSDHSKATAWSEWRLTDKKGRPWVGSLLITKRFTRENAYSVVVSVERAR